MPEPILTVLSVCLGYASLCGYGRNQTGISDEAMTTRKAVAKVLESRERSQALFGEKAAAISSIQEIVRNCAEDDWDGYDAVGVDGLAAWNAEEFIRALPDGFPLPEVAAEPDGSISLDWITSKNQMFSLSVGESNRFAVAWLDGTERGHSVLKFDGTNLPTRFLSDIAPIVNYAKPAFRLA